MGKVLKFPIKDTRSQKIKEISDRIDGVLLDCLNRHELEPHELAGLVAHRLGNLIKVTEEKSKVWDLCEKLARKQATID